MLVDVNIDGCWHKRVRKGQAHSFVKLKAFFTDGFADEGEGGDKWFSLTAFETGGDGVDGVEENVG